jgi:1,4-dihydroxy-2-naphthoate octaprenyltransferase
MALQKPGNALTAGGRPITMWLKAASPPMTLVLVLQGLYGVAIARHLGGLSVAVTALTILYFVPDGIARRLINDYQDYTNGLDRQSGARPGSALALGLDMRVVWRVAITATVLAASIAACVAVLSIPWLLLLAPILILIYFGYAGGPKPLGHYAVGELLDFLVTGTGTTLLVVVVNARTLDWPSIVACTGVGLLFGALMLHNNSRDVVKDRSAGKRTLPHVIGPGGAKLLYCVAIVGYYATVLGYSVGDGLRWSLLPLLSLPWGLWLVFRFCRSELGDHLIPWVWTFHLMIANLSLFILGAFA